VLPNLHDFPMLVLAFGYDIDMIVMGRVGHRGAGRLVGSTVEHLLYKIPCSVWVVSPEQLAD